MGLISAIPVSDLDMSVDFLSMKRSSHSSAPGRGIRWPYYDQHQYRGNQNGGSIHQLKHEMQ